MPRGSTYILGQKYWGSTFKLGNKYWGSTFSQGVLLGCYTGAYLIIMCLWWAFSEGALVRGRRLMDAEIFTKECKYMNYIH